LRDYRKAPRWTRPRRRGSVIARRSAGLRTEKFPAPHAAAVTRVFCFTETRFEAPGRATGHGGNSGRGQRGYPAAAIAFRRMPHDGTLGAHLLALAGVASVCSVAGAYAVRPAHSPEAWPATRIVRVANTQAARVPTRCLVARRGVDRALGSMVAPVRTVRLRSPLQQTPPLHASGYVFPLATHVWVADTFGAARDGVSWHHGDDLFAPRGTPVRAVAAGVLFSVGWQRLGGRRLWLRDRAGNEFYYAHLDGYTRGARNGAHARAGAVIAYLGNSGDAEQTPPHLHFEIHPASLLGLGYDGAVDPTAYLRSWAGAPPVADAVVSAAYGNDRHPCSAD